MPKLTDTQAILLSTAAQRSDESLLPPPASLGALSDRIRGAVAALIKRGFAAEQPVADTAQRWRGDSEQLVGAVITDAGRRAINIDPDIGDAIPEGDGEAGTDEASVRSSSEPRPTKTALVLTLLQRDQGATLAELVAATGWLPHTTRAALTGLRKKKHDIVKGKRDDTTCYTLAA